MIGRTISHYKILEKLGEGGMGEVYLAEDKKLKRKVILKFIQPKSTSDKNVLERFEREAQAAAVLNHPNIVTVYEIGEHRDRTFIAMEYVKGNSLRDKISKGPIPIDQAVDISKQVSDGLSKAHEAGIIHRDIKPENILVDQDGRVKIVDFGLARMKGATQLTKDAATLGTLKYMSPEQYQNKKGDHRTDIWSFGVVLFEMLTGQLPFEGDYEAAVMYAVVNEEPKSVHTLRQDIPEKFEQIVSKCIEKNPESRYQSMGEVLEELKKPISSKPVLEKKEKSIVVLPFDDMSPNKDNEYFSDGLTEEIISDLSQIQDLRVISRSSAMTYKKTKKKIKDICRELNVAYVLEGSVRKAGNNLRITAQLIEAKTDSHLWAEKYSGTLDDIFDIQERVSRSIANALKLKLSPEEARRITERPIKDLVAYECCLRAKKKMAKWTEDAIDNAIVLLERALQIEGPNEYLYVTLGQAYTNYCSPLPLKQVEPVLEKAESFAEKVFELNPKSAEGHALKGLILFHRGETKDALVHLKKTFQLAPQNSSALLWSTGICGISGKIEAARFYYHKLTAIEPWSGINPGWIEYYSGDFEKAIDGYRKEYEMDPESPYTRWAYGVVLAWARRTDDACEILEKILKDTPESIFGQFASFLINALRGRNKEALGALTPEAISMAKDQWQMPWMIAAIYSLIGETDESLDWLEHAINRGFINYPFLAEKEPFLENIRSEERFKKLMKRVKKEWENFEV